MMSNTTVVLVMSHTAVVLMVNHSSCKQDELHLISCSSLYSVLAIIPLFFFSFLLFCVRMQPFENFFLLVRDTADA